MSVLGSVVRVRSGKVSQVCALLEATEGVDVGANPGDGRLVLVIEDTKSTSAAQTFAAISLFDDVISALLVYEYSGPDDLHASPGGDDVRYQSWRTTLAELAQDHPLTQFKSS